MLELLLGAADFGLDDVERLLGRDAVGRAARCGFLLGDRLVGQRRVARSSAWTASFSSDCALRRSAMALRYAAQASCTSGLIMCASSLPVRDAVADLHEDLDDLAVDLRPDARRAALVEREDARRLELVAARRWSRPLRHDEAGLFRRGST